MPRIFSTVSLSSFTEYSVSFFHSDRFSDPSYSMKTCPQNKNAVKITRPQPAAKIRTDLVRPHFITFSVPLQALGPMPHARSASGVCHPADALPRRARALRPESAHPAAEPRAPVPVPERQPFSAHPPPKALRKTRLSYAGTIGAGAYSQYIGFITPCIGIGSLFQQASNALVQR